MARTEIVTGANALSASLAAGTGLIQLEQVGGFQTFNSSSYNTGFTAADEFLRPDGDVTSSDWGPLTLFSQIDEVTPDGATTEITSSAVSALAPSSSLRIFEVDVTALDSPKKVTNASISLVVAKSGSFSAATGSAGDSTASLEVQVRQGAVTLATRTFADIGTDFETVSFVLTDTELAAVTEWDGVRIHAEFDLSVSTGSSAVNGRCTQAQVQLEMSSILEAPPVDNLVYRLTWGT